MAVTVLPAASAAVMAVAASTQWAACRLDSIQARLSDGFAGGLLRFPVPAEPLCRSSAAWTRNAGSPKRE